MSTIFESLMILCFGISWPISVMKMLKTKSIEGKSVVFSFFIWFGYCFGILGKVLSHSLNYSLFFYLMNFCVVSFDIFLYFRIKKSQTV